MPSAADSMLLDIEPPDISALTTEDDAPLDNVLSEKQQRLLTEPLYTSWSGPPPAEDGTPRSFFAAANVGIFATLRDPPLVPDVFLSLDVSAHADLTRKENRSYFFWEFGKPPDVVIEIVSNREGDEMGGKRRRYARMRIGHYAVWDPLGVLGGAALQAFELRGDLFVPMEAPFFPAVGLGLTPWRGLYEGHSGGWLRWHDGTGRLVQTGAERAAAAAERAAAADERANRLAERLRAMGVDPDAK